MDGMSAILSLSDSVLYETTQLFSLLTIYDAPHRHVWNKCTKVNGFQYRGALRVLAHVVSSPASRGADMFQDRRWLAP